MFGQFNYLFLIVMRELTYTLLSDGTSDQALMPIINWTIRQHYPDLLIQAQWADFSYLRKPPSISSLSERIRKALELFPCDLLIIHRDAERQSVEERHQEITKAWEKSESEYLHKHAIGVVPIRMTEAWLLVDVPAIRLAAGNPHGAQPIRLPALSRLETLPDPKQILHQFLHEASGLTGRRLRKFNVSRAVQLVANNIQDFSPLRRLAAYQTFDASIRTLLNE